MLRTKGTLVSTAESSITRFVPNTKSLQEDGVLEHLLQEEEEAHAVQAGLEMLLENHLTVQ